MSSKDGLRLISPGLYQYRCDDLNTIESVLNDGHMSDYFTQLRTGCRVLVFHGDSYLFTVADVDLAKRHASLKPLKNAGEYL